MAVALFYIVLPLLLLLIGGSIGTYREQRHLRELTTREAAATGVMVTNLKVLPPEFSGQTGALVTGNVVIATDYLKQFLASCRALVGGEVKSYRAVMDRARREARLRMVEEAGRMGSRLILNIRYTTAEVGNGATEVICYGTAVRVSAPR